MSAVLATESLCKRYPKASRLAVNDVTCIINAGEIVGLLGPNGAGKSTFVKLACGITPPTSGVVRVCGLDPWANPTVKRRLAVVHQSAPMDQMLPGLDNIKIAAAFRGLRWREVREHVDTLLHAFDIADVIDQLAFTLSGGQRRRLQLVRSLLTIPELLILDEPSAGLDVQGRRQMWDVIAKYSIEHGTAIVWTSHYIEEIERNCARVLVIDRGKLIRADEPARLVAEFGQQSILALFPDADDLARILTMLPEDGVTSIGNGRLSINGAAANEHLGLIVDTVRDCASRGATIQFRTPSLEDAYVALVGGDHAE
jgi:ABC-2 type transport system ATP-binding protein